MKLLTLQYYHRLSIIQQSAAWKPPMYSLYFDDGVNFIYSGILVTFEEPDYS